MSASPDFLVPGVLLRISKVLVVIPFCKAKWYQGIKDGIYPAPVNIGPHSVAWKSDDIIALRDKLFAGEWKPNAAGKTLKKEGE